VDILTRTIAAPEGVDPADAVRAWLARPAQSPKMLRATPVILLWPRSRCGEVIWTGEPGLPAQRRVRSPSESGDDIGRLRKQEATPTEWLDRAVALAAELTEALQQIRLGTRTTNTTAR
jgi:hypothetical protein